MALIYVNGRSSVHLYNFNTENKEWENELKKVERVKKDQ